MKRTTAQAPPLGVVLAGGRSRRLGRDKARLTISRDGAALTLVEWAIRRLQICCDEIVVAGPPSIAPAGMPVVADGPAPGPAGGLLGAAGLAPGRDLLALACDLPWLPASALERLLQTAEDDRAPEETDLVLYRSAGGLEPLCALWRPRALEQLARRCRSGAPSLQAIVSEPDLACEVLDGERYGIDAFFNLNRPEDLDRYRVGERRTSERSGDPCHPPDET